jgi:SAM-dependent methyltransferase
VRQDEGTKILAQSFGQVAHEYDRLRPDVPPEALDWALPSDASRIMEIGAGTGKVTRLLVARGAEVHAVEPDARMRAVLEATTPGADIVDGRAEELPAVDSSLDAVIASSAWHWVDEQRAVPEVARVLRPGGVLALLWCGPDRTVDWMRALWAGGAALTEEVAEQVDATRRRRHTVDLGDQNWFEEPETHRFMWTNAMSSVDLVALAGTYSAVITMPEAQRRQYLDSMTRFLSDHLAGSDSVEVPMRCLCWRARRR